MTLNDMLREIQALPVRDRKALIRLIVDSLPDDDAASAEGKRSITELRGLGKEIWQDIDVHEYIEQLRSEWDHRP